MVVTVHERLDLDGEFVEGVEGMPVVVLVFENRLERFRCGMVVIRTSRTNRAPTVDPTKQCCDEDLNSPSSLVSVHTVSRRVVQRALQKRTNQT